MSGLTFFLPKVTLGRTGGGGWGVVTTSTLRFFSFFSYTIKHQHLTFSVAICLSPRAFKTSLVMVSHYGYEV